MTALPPFLMTSDEDSFAHQTIEKRKPLIIDQILSDFDYSPEIRKGLLDFKKELDNEPVRPLEEKTSDRLIWDGDLEPWTGKTWLEIPWYLAETFFYRRILEIIQYFQPGPWQALDPYRLLKDNELAEALTIFEDIYTEPHAQPSLVNFQKTCYRALWGNRGDLSNLNVFETSMGEQTDRIVLNQSSDAFTFLSQKKSKIAYFMDNAGKEMLFDLALIDYLLMSGLARSVTCYLKNQPFFVSDAMPEDFNQSIDYLLSSDSDKVRKLAQRISQFQQKRTILLEAPPFLTTGRMYRHMPDVLKSQIADYDLVILKGDVNYRRLFDDRHWDPTTPVVEAANYFPTSFLSLRTLKAEIILGITQETHKQLLNDDDPKWLINGKRGMITFLKKRME